MVDSTDAEPTRCRHCGEPLEERPQRRVVSSIEDGQVVHRQFCTDECLESWDD